MIADESLNKNLLVALRNAGHDILSISEQYFGISDEEVAEMSLFPPRIIISEDKDFGELVYHQKTSVAGVILLRYQPHELEIIKHRLLSFLSDYKQSLQGKFVVVTFDKTRIRGLE